MAPSDVDEAAILAESYWESLKGDVRATLDEYEAEGYETRELHPGTTAVLSPEYGDDLCGLTVLVLQDELHEVDSMINSAGFEGIDVYASRMGNIVLLGLFFKSTDPARVLGFPSYYLPEQADEMLERATEAGELSIQLRTQFDESLVIECSEPELFVPDAIEDAV